MFSSFRLGGRIFFLSVAAPGQKQDTSCSRPGVAKGKGPRRGKKDFRCPGEVRKGLMRVGIACRFLGPLLRFIFFVSVQAGRQDGLLCGRKGRKNGRRK